MLLFFAENRLETMPWSTSVLIKLMQRSINFIMNLMKKLKLKKN